MSDEHEHDGWPNLVDDSSIPAIKRVVDLLGREDESLEVEAENVVAEMRRKRAEGGVSQYAFTWLQDQVKSLGIDLTDTVERITVARTLDLIIRFEALTVAFGGNRNAAMDNMQGTLVELCIEAERGTL